MSGVRVSGTASGTRWSRASSWRAHHRALVLWYTVLQRLVPRRSLGRVSSLDWLISIAGRAGVLRARGAARGGSIGAARTLIAPGASGGAVVIAFLYRAGRSRHPSATGRHRGRETRSAERSRARRRLVVMEYTHVGRLGLVVSPAVPRHDELRPARVRARLALDHGCRDRQRHQLLRHRERLRAPPRGRRDRGDHRPVDRQGRRPARQGRAGHEGLRHDGRLAQRVASVEARDRAASARSRCDASAPTASISTRCTTSTGTRGGTRSGRRWSS